MTDDTREPVDDEPADDELEQPVDDEPAEPAGDELEQPVDDEPAEPAGDDAASFAIVEALDKEANRHERALAKALGIRPEAMHMCPTCQGMGYTPDALELDADPPQDPYLERCERCAGTGSVRTGATRRALYEIPCPGCTGQGYVQLPEQPVAGVDLGNGTVGAPPYFPPAPSPVAALPEVEELRRRGYTIIDPIVVPESPPA